jgi:hypothetical protein
MGLCVNPDLFQGKLSALVVNQENGHAYIDEMLGLIMSMSMLSSHSLKMMDSNSYGTVCHDKVLNLCQ